MKERNRKLNQKQKLKNIIALFACIVILSCLIQVKTLGNYEQKYLKNPPNIPHSSNVEAPEQHWNRTWGGSMNDTSTSIAIDSSDNIYVVGTCDIAEVPTVSGIEASSSDYKWFQPPPTVETTGDIVLLKYDNEGTHQWSRTWGGSGRNIGRVVGVDSSDHIYVLGMAANDDVVLLKYDSSGTLLWNTSWTGLDGTGAGHAMKIDSENNIIIAGPQSGDVVLWKFNSMGDQLWERTWGDEVSSGSGWAVAIDTSNNIYVSGFMTIFGVEFVLDSFLLKYDSSGNFLWDVSWGGSGFEFANSLVIDSSNNIFVGGATNSEGAGDYDLYLSKFNIVGQLQWSETWGGSEIEFGMDMLALDSLDNIYLAGRTSSFGAGVSDGVLVMFNNAGEQQWNKTWGGNGDDEFISLEVDSSDDLFIVGTTQIMATDEENIVLVKYSYSSSSSPFDISGYDMLLPFGVIGLISVIILKKKGIGHTS